MEKALEQLSTSQTSGSQSAPLTLGLFPNVSPEKEDNKGKCEKKARRRGR
jgi:hypothetical protein